MNYYQHHIGDFNNATRHLSLIERAIYRDLLDMYYDTEQAIDASNLDRLARRVQCSTEEQVNALKYVLDEFFNLDNGMYVNNRCEREIAEYHGKKKQASDAGKASAAKRAAKKKKSSNGGSSNDNDQTNENSTTVEAPLNEEQSDVQPTINHKPLTNNQSNNSSSDAREENLALPPIQFSQYQPEDHKRYTLLECVNQYPIQNDFIELGKQRFSEIEIKDLILLFTNFGDLFSAKGEDSKNTPSIWLVKWYTWIQNNKDAAKHQREVQSSPKKQNTYSSASNRTQGEVGEWMSEIHEDRAPAMRDVHEVEGCKYA
jgi:uncharacterized protein YdaU (DUF1376 family)